MDPNARFVEIAESLFGPDCSRPTALALDLNPRSVQRWLTGTNPVPPGVLADLQDLADRVARADLSCIQRVLASDLLQPHELGPILRRIAGEIERA